MNPLALIIDDEIQIRRLLRYALESAEYTVCEADNGQSGLMEAALRRPDVIVLDLGLPDLDGVEVIKRLREWSETPVLVLSVRDGEEQKVLALDAGADDYVTKPFSTLELLARLRVVQRRVRIGEEVSVFTRNGLQVDLVSRQVQVDGVEIHLTGTEYALLRLLIRHVGKVLTHRQILREIWGPKAEEHRQYLRVYITHLRKKLESQSGPTIVIKTEAGIGYRLVG